MELLKFSSLYTVTELVHVPNGFTDRLGNQLTTPLVTITERGQMLHMTYANEASDLQISVYMANQLGHINSRDIYKSIAFRISDDARVLHSVSCDDVRI